MPVARSQAIISVMRSAGSTRVLLWSPEGRTRRSRLPDRLAVLSVAAAVYLLLALIGPGAFLLADGAADALHRVHGSVDQLVSPVDRSPERFAEAGGRHHDPHPASGPKRLRGVLESGGNTAKMLGIFVLHEVPEVQAEHADSRHEPALVDARPEESTPPPQLLQRPPPEK